jgi:hypothetical protein
VVANGAGSAGGGDGGAGEIKGGLGGAAPEAGAGAAGEDVTLDADDGADEGGPLGVGEGAGGIEVRIPTKAATNSNLIAATIPI